METLLNRLENGMLDYIEGEDDADYSPSDVKQCIELLTSFENAMTSNDQGPEASLELVKDLVIALNNLNEGCGECLIETDQREDICEFVDSVLTHHGIEFEGDVTEEWREW